MTTLIIIVTLAALWSVIEMCAWGASEAESDENRRVAKGRGVMMVFGVIALCLWGLSASASTVQLDPRDSGLVWTAEGFRPVSGPDAYEAKYSCPRVGRPWKHPQEDRVMRETRCPVPEDAGIRWVAPLGLGPAPSTWHQSTSYGSPGGGGGFFPPGGGGSCGCGGGHTPPHETPAPIPLPWPGAMLAAALGGLVMMRKRKA